MYLEDHSGTALNCKEWENFIGSPEISNGWFSCVFFRYVHAQINSLGKPKGDVKLGIIEEMSLEMTYNVHIGNKVGI